MKISVIIPTFNEAETIGQLVADIKQYGGRYILEVLVVDAASTDNTLANAAQAGAIPLKSPQSGRAAQMNYAARQSRGDILYFVHADVKVNPDFAIDIQQAIAAGYKSGCYRFRFNSSHPMLRLNSFGTRFAGLMSRGGDQTLFICRHLFDLLNGFDERYVIMEDFDIIIRIRKCSQFCIIPKDVIVSARKYETNSWIRVQLANLTAFSMFYLNVPPIRIAQTYKRLLNYR